MSFASAHYRQEVDGLRVRSNTKSAIFELIDVADLSTLRSSAETYATNEAVGYYISACFKGLLIDLSVSFLRAIGFVNRIIGMIGMGRA
jgi:hypothetical protein